MSTVTQYCTSVEVLKDNQVLVKVGRRRAGRDIELVPVMRLPSLDKLSNRRCGISVRACT
jgi:hypothetical protein